MRGWHRDSYRHSLAARGVTTNHYFSSKHNKYFAIMAEPKTFGDGPGAPSPEDRGKKGGKKGGGDKKGGEGEGKGPSMADWLRERFGITVPQRGFEAPSTTETRGKGQEALSEYVGEEFRRKRLASIALEDLKNDDYSTALKLLQEDYKSEKDMKILSDAERIALKSALASKAMQLANAGIVVPEELSMQLDPAQQQEISDLVRVKRRERSAAMESPLKKELKRELGVVSKQALDAPAVGLEFAGEGVEMIKGAETEGTVSQINKLGQSEYIKTNASIGREEDGYLNTFKDIPSLKDIYGFTDGVGAGVNPVLMKTPASARRAADIFQDQVDSLYKYKSELAKVDLSAFEKGDKAFKAGDREKLIESIASLKSEESKLKDRWDLIGQTHKNIISIQNHSSSFNKSSDSNPLWGIGKQGGGQLVDQTEKINKVREDIVKANDRVFGRRRMLEYKLQRLEAAVPPESDVPRTVKRFEEKKGFFSSVPNMVVDELKGGRANGGV